MAQVNVNNFYHNLVIYLKQPWKQSGAIKKTIIVTIRDEFENGFVQYKKSSNFDIALYNVSR